ncbi:hypothetical protein GCM10023213_24080 [Prosthecobacter algae]|uniref:Uncharacterized protein n=1 Tax=Prosthecobacter algae TaxID=1144682 RepID=A0ABP9P9S5_9BACT
MDTSPELLKSLLNAKAERRVALVKASFAEKIEMLIRLQEMTAPILRRKGIDAKPWSHLKQQVRVS